MQAGLVWEEPLHLFDALQVLDVYWGKMEVTVWLAGPHEQRYLVRI